MLIIGSSQAHVPLVGADPDALRGLREPHERRLVFDLNRAKVVCRERAYSLQHAESTRTRLLVDWAIHILPVRIHVGIHDKLKALDKAVRLLSAESLA